MLCIALIATEVRSFRTRLLLVLVGTFLVMVLLVCQHESLLFPLDAAQSTTDSSQASTEAAAESPLSLEGSLSIVIFMIATFLLVRWALREKPLPGKRYHRNFAPLWANGSDKGDRYRADAPDHTGDTPGGGGAHGGND